MTLTVARQQMSLPAMTLPGGQLVAMQEVMQPRSKTMISHTAPSCLCRLTFLETLILGLASVLTLLVVPAILSGKNLSAQTLAPQGTKPVRQQKAAAQPAELQPPTPEAIAMRRPATVSPADQPPNPARVSSDARGLEIEASNSSLNRILQQVAADTGAKLEGLAQDQRVFGTYGPGPRSDVLLKLLDGSGYNVLIISGRDSDAPLEIVLSARLSASPQTSANNQNRGLEQPEPEPQRAYSSEPPRPQPVQNPFGNGEPPRDPMQLMQEILQRQQKIDQQQDQQNNSQQ
jgi:hypothetical protein